MLTWIGNCDRSLSGAFTGLLAIFLPSKIHRRTLLMVSCHGRVSSRLCARRW